MKENRLVDIFNIINLIFTPIVKITILVMTAYELSLYDTKSARFFAGLGILWIVESYIQEFRLNRLEEDKLNEKENK